MEVMTALISAVTEFLTAALGWVTDVAGVVTTEPLLILMCIAIPIAGFGIGALNRMLRLS